ncbi:protein Njmu-R1-like isoform X2 [Dendronephthya gigantea]|uniref:protein Njmu-R1-like isoform X2 n=1 Tax=Dendronephthya gigantea TaxID=151771 RepID=UPI00106D478A|nr:protein Njmu-R1-like isoform X2 [Dendronephthya gigantea]
MAGQEESCKREPKSKIESSDNVTVEDDFSDPLFDVMDSEEKDMFVKGYCLYKHMTNRPLTSSTDDTKEKTVINLLKDESASNKNFSLSLLNTDLEAEQEARLQDFLIKRLTRSSIYNNTSGSLATLSHEDISEKPVMCYYKLIKGPKFDLENQSNVVVNEHSTCCLDFLVCFVVSETSNLYLFQQELERFCKSYEASLSSLVQTEVDISKIFKDLVNWYDINVLYVCRCTKLFQLELSALINTGLLGQKLSILNCNQQQKEDIARFVDVCSLSNLLSSPVKESNHKILENLEKKPKEVNTLTFSDLSFKFNFASKEGICEVCNDWAKTMVEGEQDNPVFLRQVMENYKLKVIQDMNSLKRLLREAEADHYALFRSYVFLSKCVSSRIVMEHIRQEAETSMTKEICDIIEVLDDFIAEKGGFSEIYLQKKK